MTRDELRRRRALLAAGLAALAAPSVRAQRTYPERPVKAVVPNAPGSSVDTIGRALSIELAKVLAQPLVVDNRAGAAGGIGVDVVRNAASDGYTVLVGSSSAISVAPLLQKAVSYQPPRDFELVSLIALLPNVLVCNPGLPVQNVRELIELGRSRNGDLKTPFRACSRSRGRRGLKETVLRRFPGSKKAVISSKEASIAAGGVPCTWARRRTRAGQPASAK